MRIAPGMIFVRLLVVTILCSGAAGQSHTPTTGTEFWPEGDAHIEISSNFRVLAFGGLQQGSGFPYQQWYAAAGFGYQFKPILKTHFENIDPDKEHHLVVAGGYEFFRTMQSGKTKDESRLVLEAIPGFRPSPRFLVRDTNRLEYRWVNGVYSIRYRNRLRIERDFLVHGLRFTPYGFAEAFYDAAKNFWNQEYYSLGAEWPYKRFFMLDTYYLRQACPTCKPAYTNVGGLTLNFYF